MLEVSEEARKEVKASHMPGLTAKEGTARERGYKGARQEFHEVVALEVVPPKNSRRGGKIQSPTRGRARRVHKVAQKTLAPLHPQRGDDQSSKATSATE